MIKAGIPILISVTDLLNYIPQEDIAFRYISGFNKIGNFFKSEFRSEKEPSSTVFVGKRGDLLFKDFGDPNLPKAITVIQYVQHKYQLEYQSAINKIAIDFGLIDGKSSDLSLVNVGKGKIKRGVYKPPSDPTIIRVKKRKWGQHDVDYWSQFCITTKLLESNNIFPISHVWFNNKPPIEFTSDYNVYTFDYYYSKFSKVFQRKIYQPLDTKGFKWFSNVDHTTVQHVNKIPKEGGELLVITSSLKDAMIFELLNIYSIAPNSESSFLPEKYWNKIKDRWKHIYLYLDNDMPGIKYAERLSKEYSIPYVYNEAGEPKDISDYVKKYGLEKTRQLVEHLIIKNI